MVETNPFKKNIDQYEKWFEDNRCVYRSELKVLKHFVPDKRKRVEIGNRAPSCFEKGHGKGGFAVIKLGKGSSCE